MFRLSLRSLNTRSAFRVIPMALVLAGMIGLSAIATQAAPMQKADAASASWLNYQHGYYLDNGWLCYGWSNGEYHCTQHWHRAANGHLVSDHASWVPNYGVAAPAAHANVAHIARTVVNTRPRTAPAPVAPPASGGSVVNEIKAVFGPYSGAALAVARCESGYNPNAYNRGSGASGVFQFLASTWRTTSYAGYSPFNANANIHAAYQVFSRDGHSWREWQCQP